MLQIYTLEESDKWDNIVSSFSKHDIYYMSGYVKAFYIHGDGEPLLFYYEGNGKDQGVRGINVVMKRDIFTIPELKNKFQENTYFDLTTPYGYGGWLIEGFDECNNLKQLFTDYERWCVKNGIISEFVRFHPMLKNQAFSEDNYTVIPLGETIAIDLESPEIIWNNIISKNKNVIRKAVKNDVKIYSGRSPELFEKFKKIYDKTMDKDDANHYYYFEPEFYWSILNDLPENAQIFYAEIPDGTIIAASIMLVCNGYMNYHLSGSVREYNSLAATNLLLYRAALWGCTNGCKTLYLGGGVGSGEDSLFKFKKSFYKGELNRFYIGKKVINYEKYDELCQVAGIQSNSNNLRESGFFPEYRQ